MDKLDPRPSTDEQRQASHLYAQAGEARRRDGRWAIDAVGQDHRRALRAPIRRSRPRRTDRGVARDRGDVRRSAGASRSRVLPSTRPDGTTPTGHGGNRWRPWDRAAPASSTWSGSARLACTGDGEGAASALLATLRLGRVLPPSFFGSVPVPTSHSLQSLLTLTSPSEANAGSTSEGLRERGRRARRRETPAVHSRAQWLSFDSAR